jgi:hypothetical protein
LPPTAGAPPGAYVKVATDSVAEAGRLVLERLGCRCQGWKFRDETERQWLEAPDDDAFGLLPEPARGAAREGVLMAFLRECLGQVDCGCARRVVGRIEEGADLLPLVAARCPSAQPCATRSLLRPYRLFMDGLVTPQEWANHLASIVCDLWGPVRPAGSASGVDLTNYLIRSAYPGLLREVLGNPFRPPAVDPAWLARNDAAAAAVATAIEQERRFSDMPILADALEEAGCADGAILGHCRQPAGHVAGCWVLRCLREA